MIKRNVFKEHFIVLFFYIFLTIILTYPIILEMNVGVASASGDVWQFVWNFWWFKKALIDLHKNPFYTDYLFYPKGTSLLFSLTMPFKSLLSIPFQFFFSLTFIYNLFVFITFVVSAYGTYLLVKYLTNNKIAAIISGIIFSFSSIRMVRVFAGHIYLLNTEFIPFYVLFLIKSVREKSRKYAIYAGIFLALNLFSDLMYSSFLLLFTLLYFLYNFILHKNLIPKMLKSFSIILLVFLLISFPYLYSLFKEYYTVEYFNLHRQLGESEYYSADLAAFFTIFSIHSIFGKYTKGLWASESLVFSGNWNESTVFIGYTVFILAILCFLKVRNEKEINFWKICLIFFFLMALGPTLHVWGKTRFTRYQIKIPLPIYTFIFKASPLFDISRGPSRFTIMIAFSLAILSAYTIKIVIDSKFRFRKILIFLIVFLIIFESLAIPIPYNSYSTVHPKFIDEMSKEKEDYAILNIPSNYIADYLILQTIHNKSHVLGFVSRQPNYIWEFSRKIPIINQLIDINKPEGLDDIINQNLSKNGLSIFNYYNIKYVIFYKRAILSSILERQIKILENIGMDIRYDDEETIVYEAKKDNLHPFVKLGDNWKMSYDSEYWRSIHLVNNVPTRFVQTNNATIIIINPKNESIKAKLNFNAMGRNRELIIYLNNKKINTYKINEISTQYLISEIVIEPGENQLMFYTEPDCCGSLMEFQNITMLF